jgi:undecaprenyl pyrophosphate phosphatase UppP
MYTDKYMRIFNIIERATDFGTFRSRNSFWAFALKAVLYIIPAVILGHYTDKGVKTLKEREAFGDNAVIYILLQTLCVLITLYLFVLFLTDFTSEFQTTAAGSYFIVLYFGMQSNYISMLKEYMH